MRGLVLLVCLRHLGCAFTREALADLRQQRAAVERAGARIVIAHLEPPSAADPVLKRYGFDDVETISDPDARVYETCGVGRGGLRQLIGTRVLRRWVGVAIGRRLGAGWATADVRRMAGAFLVENGRIRRAFRCTTSADRLDYARLLEQSAARSGK